MSDPRIPVRSEFRDYQLAREFGWDKATIDDQPAVWLDWLLAIHAVVRRVEIDASHGQM